MFVPGMRQSQAASGRRWLGVWSGHVLVLDDDFLFASPPFGQEPQAGLTLDSEHIVGYWSGVEVVVQLLAGEPDGNYFDAQQPRRLTALRSFLTTTDATRFQMLGSACQLWSWRFDHQFCGRCGQMTELCPDDRCYLCVDCNHRHYPRLSPCVIMLITRGDQCLLAQHRRAGTQSHTALAGFVEPGETLEAAVHREALEEVGLTLSSLHYFASQPWPFPGQLMVGFMARTSQQRLRLQDEEIASAAWYHRHNLPDLIPPEETLSGQLIRAFANQKLRV